MRKLFLFNFITLDGFFEGPGHDISWHNVDAEFNEFAVQQLDEIGTLLFGRVTYELMAGYWPTPTGIEDDPVVARMMNTMEKVVFSRSLTKAEWSNTRLVKENAGKEVERLKQQTGKDIGIFGSANLAAEFIRLGLVDEFRLMVNPVVLGKGVPLFNQPINELLLQNERVKLFRSGNVLLCFRPIKEGSPS